MSLLLRLLNGSAAADEKAAVDYFGIAGDAQARLAARRHLGGISAWVDELVPRVTAPVPQHPTASEMHERIYVVRALGVAGGPRAEAALAQVRDRSDIALFDDFVRVVLIDRLRGTRLETPLAFAVPPSARTMRDIVDAALADARDLGGQLAPAPREPTLASVNAAAGATAVSHDAVGATAAGNDAAPAPEPRPTATPAVSDQPNDTTTPHSPIRRLLPWIVCILAFIITSRLLKGRR